MSPPAPDYRYVYCLYIQSTIKSEPVILKSELAKTGTDTIQVPEFKHIVQQCEFYTIESCQTD